MMTTMKEFDPELSRNTEECFNYPVPSNLVDCPEAVTKLLPVKVTNGHILSNILHYKYLAQIRQIESLVKYQKLKCRLDQTHAFVEAIHAQNGALLHGQKDLAAQISLISTKLDKLCETRTPLASKRPYQDASTTNTGHLPTKQPKHGNDTAPVTTTTTACTTQASVLNANAYGGNYGQYTGQYTSTPQFNAQGSTPAYNGQAKDWFSSPIQYSNNI